MKIGAHISTAGGVHNIFQRAEEIEAEAIQMFIYLSLFLLLF